MRPSSRIFIVSFFALLSGCQHSTPYYLLQQGMMQGSFFMRAIPVDEALKSEDTSESDKKYLRLSQNVLNYARSDLGLKCKGSYEKFLKLDRPWVTKVVVAAYRDRPDPYLFRFPLFGDLPYRGYFQEETALSFAAKLSREKNLDTMVRPVPAYSTTGWLSDPIVSTMFRSDLDLAEVLFHELVHLQFYFKSNADFNEAFATWFAGKALRKFVTAQPGVFHDGIKALERLDDGDRFDLAFSNLIVDEMAKARTFYAQKSRSDEERKKFFEEFRRNLVQLDGKRKWPEYPELNNAFLVSSSTYFRKVPLIEKYASLHKLDATKMLERVIATGPSIIGEIEKLAN
jgi:predicted aminopeptidase